MQVFLLVFWPLQTLVQTEFYSKKQRIHKITTNNNETPTVRGLAADNNNKLYTETMIFL